MRANVNFAIAAALAFTGSGAAWAADPATINWKSVPVTTLTLFYPGQSSYQWLRGPEHAGAKPTLAGTGCVTCHKGQEVKLGDKLVKANKLEPTPVTGKNGALQLTLQVAYDKENAYFRAQWRTRNNFPGDAYLPLRFDGKEWKSHGGPKLDKAVQSGAQPAIYEDRFSIIIDNGAVPDRDARTCPPLPHQPTIRRVSSPSRCATIAGVGENQSWYMDTAHM